MPRLIPGKNWRPRSFRSSVKEDSIHFTREAHNDYRFAELKMCMAGQTPAQAGAANRLLLITFTDILASLIGEHLTTSIMRSAWGDDASNKAGKEFKNE
jgi:hypothetical protein